jgi:hypothetical protein
MSDPAAHQPQKAGAPSLRPLSGESARETEPDPIEDDEPSKGINLTLVYSLIALALVAAIGLALLIVFPFYHRR